MKSSRAQIVRIGLLPAYLALIGIAVLVDRQLAGTIDPDVTTVALILLYVVLALAVAYPRHLERIVERVSNVKFAGIELGLEQADRASVADSLPTQGQDYGTIPVDPLPSTGTALGDLAAVRDRLTDRLEWLAREFEVTAGPPGVVVERLLNRGLIDAEQERFLLDLLHPHRSDLPALPVGVQEQYIERAWRFVNRLRPAVLDQAVRLELRAAGWFLADYEQQPHHRPDFLAFKDGRWILIAPRVALTADSATNQNSGQISKTLSRWEKRDGVPVPVDRRVIVIPNESRAPERDGDPAVIARKGVLALLG